MSQTLLATIFLPLFLTLMIAAGGVYVFRGSYYKTLPGRVRELEQDVERKDAALKRQDRELQFVKGIANQTPEILALTHLFGVHTETADKRFDSLEAMFKEISETQAENHRAIIAELASIRQGMIDRGNDA